MTDILQTVADLGQTVTLGIVLWITWQHTKMIRSLLGR